MLLRPLHKDLEFIEESLPMTKNMQAYIWALMSRHEDQKPVPPQNNRYIDDNFTIANIKRSSQELLAEQLRQLTAYMQ